MEKILAIRDPQGFLRQEVIGYFEDQETNQLLFDAIEALSREQAMLIFHVLDAKLVHGYPIDPKELQELILSEYRKILQETPRMLH